MGIEPISPEPQTDVRTIGRRPSHDGAHGWSRTSNLPRIRRMLEPIELRARLACCMEQAMMHGYAMELSKSGWVAEPNEKAPGRIPGACQRQMAAVARGVRS